MTVTLTKERLKFCEFLELMQLTQYDHRVPAAQGFLRGIDDDDLRARLQPLIEAHLQGIELAQARRKMVVLVHGIRTQAAWFKIVKEELDHFGGFEVAECKYGYFDLLSFLCPVLFRGIPKKKTLKNINAILAENVGADLYLISHSNGTYVMSHLLQESPHVKFKGIIFCGAIVNEDFHWDRLKGFPSGMFINEIGTKDLLPVLAKISTIGYGASGRFGFNYFDIQNRFHDLDHSGFFSREFISTFWTPFLVHGEKVKSSWDLQKPEEKWLVEFIGSKPSCLLILAIIVGSLFVFSGYQS